MPRWPHQREWTACALVLLGPRLKAAIWKQGLCRTLIAGTLALSGSGFGRQGVSGWGVWPGNSWISDTLWYGSRAGVHSFGTTQFRPRLPSPPPPDPCNTAWSRPDRLCSHHRNSRTRTHHHVPTTSILP